MFLKRLIDLVLAASALVVLSPVFAGCAIAIWVVMGSPVIFQQIRPGIHGRLFATLKFRTMLECNAACGLITDEQRLTSLGRILRATSLDELPQLWNILRGDMSLVGPRPLLPEYLARYSARQQRRHDVLPGVTGWAQINGRQDIPFSIRLEHDVWYVENQSTYLDLKILLLTVVRVFSGQGVRSGQDVADVDDIGLSRPQGQIGDEPATDLQRHAN